MADDQAVSGAILPASVGGKAEDTGTTAPLMTNKKTAAQAAQANPNATIQTRLLFNDSDKAELSLFNTFHHRREWMAKNLAEMDVRVWNTNCQLQATDRPQVFRHTLFNDCDFPIGVRLSCSNANRMRTERTYFCMEPGARYDFSVTIQPRHPKPDISERVVIGTMPVSEHFRQWPDWRARISMIFRMAFLPVNFVIRYQKVPLWTHSIEQLSRFKIVHSGLEKDDFKKDVDELLSGESSVDEDYKDYLGFVAMKQALEDENGRVVEYWQKEMVKKKEEEEEQKKKEKAKKEAKAKARKKKEENEMKDKELKEQKKENSAEDEKKKKSGGDSKDKKKSGGDSKDKKKSGGDSKDKKKSGGDSKDKKK